MQLNFTPSEIESLLNVSSFPEDKFNRLAGAVLITGEAESWKDLGRDLASLIRKESDVFNQETLTSKTDLKYLVSLLFLLKEGSKNWPDPKIVDYGHWSNMKLRLEAISPIFN